MLCLLSTLSACNKNMNEEQFGDNSLFDGDVMLYSHGGKYYPFEQGNKVLSVVSSGSHLMIVGSNGDSPLLGIAEYGIESDNSVIISDTVQMNLKETGLVGSVAIYGITTGGDGLFYVLVGELHGERTNGINSMSSANQQMSISILRYTASGEFLERIEISEWHSDIVNGIAVGSNGEVVIHGGSYISLLNLNGDIVKTINMDRNSFVLSVSLCGESLIASVHEITNRKTRYFLINSVSGDFSEFEEASINDYGLVLGNWFGVQGPDTIVRAVSLNSDGFNRLGIMSITQGLGNDYIVNDGFRFFTLNLDTGIYEKLYQWNYELNDIYSLKYLSRLSENVFAHTVSNGEYLIISSISE